MVEYAGTSIDQKHNHAWNYSNIMVAYRASIISTNGKSINTKI